MALFKSRRQRELEREIKARRGKARIRRFINHARTVQDRYWELGKQALRLGDREQFRRLGAAYMRTTEQVNRWQRYLLQLEALGVRREEVAATNDFIDSVSAMTRSMLKGASADQVARMQEQLQQALAKSRSIEDMLSIAMDASADSIFGTKELDEKEFGELSRSMLAEAEADEGADYDQSTGSGLERIERQMREEMQ